jgi:hypothetical protein
MPILNAGEAQQVVFLTARGVVGSPASRTSCSMTRRPCWLFGDANESLSRLLNSLKTL